MGYISGNTFIYTRKGMRFIKNIKIGDEVLTHTGAFKPVTEITGHNKKRQSLRMSHGDSVTKNPMFIDSNQEICMKNREWVQAQFVSDEFAIPGLWKDAGLTPQSFSIGGNTINNDKDLAFMIGAYLARGFIDKGNVVFRFTDKAQNIGALNQIKKVLKKKYNIKKYEGNVGRGYVGGITIVGSEVGEFFNDNFGKKYIEKHIPEWISGTDINYRRALFRGIKTTPLWKDERCFISISPTLTYQVLLLGRSIGLYGWFHSEMQDNKLIGINKAFFGKRGKSNEVICMKGKEDKLFSLKIADDGSFVAGDFIIRAV